MLHLLAQLGTTALGEIVKKMVTGGMKWAANRKQPEPDIVELKLGQIAAKNLPDTIPADQRQAVITSLVDLVMPTFEQIVEYDPTTQKIISTIRTPGTSVTNHGREHAGVWNFKVAAKKASAKKSAVAKHAVKKSAPLKRATKKAPVKKAVAKKAPAKFRMAR